MADSDDTEFDVDPGDHSPDTGPSDEHGYDAVFFLVAIVVAIVFVVAIYYLKG